MIWLKAVILQYTGCLYSLKGMKGCLILIRLLLVILAMGSAGICLADDTLVAVGDGFEVTKKDVKELRAYMMARPVSFTSTDKEHHKAALKVRLFAEEAKALGLDQDVPEGEGVGRLVALSSRYTAKVLEDYPLDDVVFESYYRAHPGLFRNAQGGSDDLDLRPLDSVLRKQIKRKIMKAKGSMIAAMTFETLKEKYHVRMVDSEKRGDR